MVYIQLRDGSVLTGDLAGDKGEVVIFHAGQPLPKGYGGPVASEFDVNRPVYHLPCHIRHAEFGRPGDVFGPQTPARRPMRLAA